MTIRLEPSEIVFSKHADARLRERTPLELDEARSEIEQACREGRVEHRSRNIFCVWSADGERLYPLARQPTGLLIVLSVLTVLAPLLAA